MFACKKAQQVTDDDVDKDLRGLATRAHRRATGEPVRTGDRQMLGVVDFGEGSWEPDTVLAFDAASQLILAVGEMVLSTFCAHAAILVLAQGYAQCAQSFKRCQRAQGFMEQVCDAGIGCLSCVTAPHHVQSACIGFARPPGQ